MSLRKEQTVLVLAVLVVGYLVYSGLSGGGGKRRSSGSAESPELPALALPQVDLALAQEHDPEGLERDLFSPPRDTRPLPPLGLVRPPMDPLPALRPPPEPGPGPKLYGRFLRVPLASVPVEGLFVAEAELEEEDDFGALPTEFVEGTEFTEAETAQEEEDEEPLTQEEVEEKIAGYKRLYDWYFSSQHYFGQITNQDRYTLSERPDESLMFIEFDRETGLQRFSGQVAIEITRDRVVDFGFADTVANQMELGRADFGDSITYAEYEDAVLFANWCIYNRLESPRALVIAEEVFRLAEPVANEDPAPRLGLARCHEAAFEFERAFQAYKTLLSEGYATSPKIYANLGRLLARFRLFERAEATLREAERYGRTNWIAQWALGRFLLERGRPAEAVDHLRVANQYEPRNPESKFARAEMRADLGAALFAVGQVDDGLAWFNKALQAEPKLERGLAAVVSVEVVRGVVAPINGAANGLTNGSGSHGSGSNGGGSLEAVDELELEQSFGFDLLLAEGLKSLLTGDWEAARDDLQLAVEADPLRAYLAYRALSFLAEAAGYPEEAQRFIEQAYENNPTDPYTLYQRGRILAANDDIDGAIESFRRTLDRELDFPDALAALGELSNRIGEYPAAERYLARALELDPSMVDVHALRGINALELGVIEDAIDAFDQALGLSPNHPVARNGRAWSFYVQGDPEEAITRFGDLEDLRRRQKLPEDDPHRVYAKQQIENISLHEEKVSWSDRFDRPELANSWDEGEGAGPTVTVRDGRVWIGGQFTKNGRTRFFRERAAHQFVAFEAEITVHAQSPVRVGLFVSREQYRGGGEDNVLSELTVSRHKEGTLQTRLVKRGAKDAPYNDVPGTEWPLDQPMRVRIERTGESKDTRIRMIFDGLNIVEDVSFPTLGTSSSFVRMGVFAEGERGRNVTVDIDNVEVVYRER